MSTVGAGTCLRGAIALLLFHTHPTVRTRSPAGGLWHDPTAVCAALTTAWSNGQTEGQVTKLKPLKRQMSGRNNFDLLRLRVLLAA